MEFESGKKLGFNFYAFLFGMFWMLYRKMHRFLLIILLVIIAESTLEFLILEWTNASLQTEQTLNKFSYFIWGSIIGLFANKGYIKMADRKISRILNLNLTQDITENKAQELDFASLQTVVSHDTSTKNVAGNAGLSLNSTRILYVQNIDQKVQAILAGLGIGHLPRYRIRQHLQDARLIELPFEADNPECFVAWEITNKGKALSALSKAMATAKW